MNPKMSKIYATLAILWCAHFLVDFMIGIWPVYKTMAHLDLAKAGMISAACAFIGEGMQVFFGPLSDRGYRQLLLLGGVFAAAATTLMAYTHDYILLFLLFLTTCLGSGAFHPSAVGLLGNLAGNRKGVFITIFASGGALGLASSQLIFSETHRFFNGHMVWLAFPVVLLILLVLYVELAPAKVLDASKPLRKISLKSFITLFRHRELSLLYISQVCNQTIAWGTMFLLPDILSMRGYEEWIAFGGGHLFFVLGGALMVIPGGYLSDKYSYKKVILGASVIGMLAFYAFLFIPQLSMPMLLSLLFLMGAMIGMINPIQIAFGNRLMPSDTGTVSAFLMGLSLCLAEGIGQGGGGLLTKYFETNAAANSLAVLGLFFIIGIAIVMKLPAKVTEEHQLEFAI